MSGISKTRREQLERILSDASEWAMIALHKEKHKLRTAAEMASLAADNSQVFIDICPARGAFQKMLVNKNLAYWRAPYGPGVRIRIELHLSSGSGVRLLPADYPFRRVYAQELCSQLLAHKDELGSGLTIVMGETK